VNAYIVWGLLVVIFPLAPFGWARIDPPNYLELWQCIGMLVGLYGVAYLLAAADPIRNWAIVMVGLAGKVLGPIGFLRAAVAGSLPWIAGWTILTNDVIWWAPFAWVLWESYHARKSPQSPTKRFNEADASGEHSE
jgi:small multidrug resistance pump